MAPTFRLIVGNNPLVGLVFGAPEQGCQPSQYGGEGYGRHNDGKHRLTEQRTEDQRSINKPMKIAVTIAITRAAHIGRPKVTRKVKPR